MASQIDNLISVCSFHPEEELDHYCKTCDRALCEDCIKLDHREHNWCKLKKVAQNIRSIASDKITQIINQEIPKIESNFQAIADVKARNKETKTDKMNRIKHHKKELVSAVKVISDNLIKERSNSEGEQSLDSEEDKNISSLHTLRTIKI
jgi:Mg2+ and Co2+ transporter CorA